MRCGYLVLLLCACGGGARPQPDPTKQPPHTDAAVVDKVIDRDHDGLCDATERQIGTDPLAVDTDGDGLPDLIELGNGFDPTDSSTPAPDQVAYLEARPGAILDFAVRATVDGHGQGVSGLFQAITSIYADGTTAEDFFSAASAVSADPVDGARSIDTSAARFDSVLGRTRLGFSLHFEYAGSAKPPECAKAYPFRYSTKSDDGATMAVRLFLLVVAPAGQAGHDASYCLPSDCQ